MVKVTVLGALVPPSLTATKFAVIVPNVLGVPVMRPVASSESPAGNPVALHDVAGRSTASVRAGRVEGKISPTFPVKLCPAVIIGAPAATEIEAVCVAVPPGPVAVSVIVVVPLSCGVPVMAPVVAFSAAQLGNPVADQLVAGRLALSVSEGVALKATPTLLGNVCPAGMSGAPAEMVTVTGVTALVPPTPEAERLTTASPVFVGVPVIAPVVALRVAHVGSELAAHDVAGKFSVSVI